MHKWVAGGWRSPHWQRAGSGRLLFLTGMRSSPCSEPVRLLSSGRHTDITRVCVSVDTLMTGSRVRLDVVCVLLTDVRLKFEECQASGCQIVKGET